MFQRSIQLPQSGSQSFFLWGPRQTGKTTLLKQTYRKGKWVDLLQANQFRQYKSRPETLRYELTSQKWMLDHQIVIDEIQKVPELLDEIHWMIENLGANFALCGSSARKVRRGTANLLGGRAVRFELFGITSNELKDQFDLTEILNRGYLPHIYTHNNPIEQLESYVDNYFREEIVNEGIVRNLPSFNDFLEAAALTDGEIANYSNIASDCGVTLRTVKSHFEILEDTLMGRWLPAWRKREKRRTLRKPKFYFFDTGVVNYLAKRGNLSPGSEIYGKAMENWVFHELSAFQKYSKNYSKLSYWRLSSGIEVDFIWGNMEAAIEVKASKHISSRHLKGLRKLVEEFPHLTKKIIVCLETNSMRTSDGIDILPAEEFARRLWSQELF